MTLQDIQRAMHNRAAFRRLLITRGVCPAGRKWARNQTLQSAWEKCESPQFMAWWLAGVWHAGLYDATECWSRQHILFRIMIAYRPKSFTMRRFHKRLECAAYRELFNPDGTLR